MRLALILPLLALPLAACEETPPSIDTDDIADFKTRSEAAQPLPVTAIADLPSGTVTYFGEFGSNADVEGVGDAIIGQMDMTVQFATQDVGGRLYNINLIEGGEPQQRMTGELELDGTAVNGVIDADATGTITRVDVGKTDFADVDLQLNGSVRDDVFVGDAVAGSVTGSGDGSFDFTLDGSGTFYGTALQ